MNKGKERVNIYELASSLTEELLNNEEETYTEDFVKMGVSCAEALVTLGGRIEAISTTLQNRYSEKMESDVRITELEMENTKLREALKQNVEK